MRTFTWVKMIRYISIFAVLMVLIVACRTGVRKDNLSAVDSFGRLDSVMAGNFDERHSLDTLSGLKNIYALGAMDSLAGELQIFDGQPFHSYMERDSVMVDSYSNPDAALLVYCQVDEWRDLSIPLSVPNIEAFVGFLEYNEDLQIETGRPFMFQIEGVVEQLDWHVLNRPQFDSIPMNGNHLYNAGRGSLSDVDVNILGVYSRAHEGIFTHHNMPVHMHFKTTDGLLAGHVEELELGPDMSLKIPRTN
ncbi:MAG: acetolactate decarboxylase [Flavobacteriaceae bacterium]